MAWSTAATRATPRTWGESLGYYGGSLTCGSDCEFDLTACQQAGWCGNGVLERAYEECDGEDLGGMSCSDRGVDGGGLACGPDCRVDTADCTACGNGVCEVGELGTCVPDCPPGALAAGWDFSCTVRGDGTVWCWGGNGSGQLGDWSTEARRLQPVQVQGLGGTGAPPARAVVAGDSHACA